MATSATIRIQDFNLCEVYKHWYGNPESILKWLQDFNRDFVKNMGHDPEYKLAQLLRSSVRDAEKYDLDITDLHTGWGVFPINGIESQYTYTLNTNGSVHVKSN